MFFNLYFLLQRETQAGQHTLAPPSRHPARPSPRGGCPTCTGFQCGLLITGHSLHTPPAGCDLPWVSSRRHVTPEAAQGEGVRDLLVLSSDRAVRSQLGTLLLQSSPHGARWGQQGGARAVHPKMASQRNVHEGHLLGPPHRPRRQVHHVIAS